MARLKAIRSPPGDQAVSPSDQHSPRQRGDLAEISAVCVDRIERFIAPAAAGLLRLHVDLSPVGTSQDADLARLLAAGARPADVGQRGDEGWHVLADPEGNEFCLLRRPLAT